MATSSSYPVPPGRLESQFGEKKPAFTRGEALAEGSRCLYCSGAPCISACPTAIDIPTFIRKITTDNLRGSARTILQANLLGASCARVCPVEVLCEGDCVYVRWGRKPIEIGRLQRYAMDHGAAVDLLAKAPPSGFSVGLVGGGPASLACAGTLALLGHQAVVYERSPLPGGLNTTGVAPYKMAVEAALAEVEFVRELGVEIHTGIDIGHDLTPAELLERHDAAFLGLGLGDDSLRGIPGGGGEGVVGAVAWIRRMKVDPQLKLAGVLHAVVVGGGNTALDVAQELASLAVPTVHLVYRRSRREMPGYPHELDGAKKLGVVFLENATIREVVRDGAGRVKGVVLVETEEGRPTDRVFHTLPADLLVVATGQERMMQLARQFQGVECDRDGHVVANPATGATGNSRVFTGGDCMNGGKEVVNAAAEGQRAARAIDAMLRRS
jgi:dihydropyrimidine dehydrogenase (NAD+) subunit PreT